MRLAAGRLSSLAIVAIVACEAAPPAERCTGIPEGGCPLSRGVACEDRSCRAVFACLPGNTWELRATCPPLDGDAAADTWDAAASLDASSEPARDASFPLPRGANGGPGCGELQLPDCSVGVAATCGAGCCGCEDIFVCAAGVWEHWGYCDASGALVLASDGGVIPP